MGCEVKGWFNGIIVFFVNFSIILIYGIHCKSVKTSISSFYCIFLIGSKMHIGFFSLSFSKRLKNWPVDLVGPLYLKHLTWRGNNSAMNLKTMNIVFINEVWLSKWLFDISLILKTKLWIYLLVSSSSFCSSSGHKSISAQKFYI